MAAQIASTGTSENVAQVFDQYLNFVVAEPDLFSLGMGKDTYWAINSAQTKDEELDMLVDRIVSGLFSVSVTMGMSLEGVNESLLLIPVHRSNPHNTMSKGRSCRNNSREAGSEVEGSYIKFEG